MEWSGYREGDFGQGAIGICLIWLHPVGAEYGKGEIKMRLE
jgi:hypothetical protein